MKTHHLIQPPERIYDKVHLDVSPDNNEYITPDIEYLELINQMFEELNQAFDDNNINASVEILENVYKLFESFEEEDISPQTEDIIVNSNVIFRSKQYFQAQNMTFSYWILKCITKICYLSSFIVDNIITFRLYQFYINPFYEENFSPECFGEMLSFIGCIAADSPKGIVTILEAYNIPLLIKKGLAMNNMNVFERCLFCSEQILTNSKFESSYRMLNETTLLFLDFARKIFCREPQYQHEEIDAIKIRILTFLSFITRNKQSVDFFCQPITQTPDADDGDNKELHDVIDLIFSFVFYEIPEDAYYRLRQTEIIYNILTGCNEEKQLDIMHKIDYQEFISFMDLRFMRSCCDFMMLTYQMIRIDENIVPIFDELSLIERLIYIFVQDEYSLLGSSKKLLMLFAVLLIYIIKDNSIIEKFLDIDFINEFVIYNNAFDHDYENLLYLRASQILYSFPSVSDDIKELLEENIPEIQDVIDFSDDMLNSIQFVVYV